LQSFLEILTRLSYNNFFAKLSVDVQKNNFKKANSEEIDVQDKSWTPDEIYAVNGSF
jgi:hypothetical protein